MGIYIVILSYTFKWAMNNISNCLWNERRLNNICNQEFSLYEKTPITYHQLLTSYLSTVILTRTWNYIELLLVFQMIAS